MVKINGYDIELTRGDTLYLRVDLGGRDLPEGTDAVFTIKKSIRSDEVLMRKRFDASDEVLGIHLSSLETRLDPGVYVWDVRLQIPQADGTVEVYTPMEYAAFVVLESVGEPVEEDDENVTVDEQLAYKELRAAIAQAEAQMAAGFDGIAQEKEAAFGLIRAGHHSAAKSGEIALIADTKAGAHYRTIIWNAVGGGGNFEKAFVYLLHADGSKTCIAPETRQDCHVYEFTAGEGDRIRLYMNKLDSAQSCACDYAVYRIDGSRLDMIETAVSTLKEKTDLLEGRTEMGTVLRGSFRSNSGGIVAEYKQAIAGMPYQVVLWNTVGGGGGYEKSFVYIMHSDGTNTRIAPEAYADSFLYHFVPAEGDYIRLYLNKLATAESCSCDYAIYQVATSRIDAVEERAGQMEKQLAAAKTSRSTCRIFRKVVCCGDSYTAGYMVDGAGVAHETNEEYAWPHYMSSATGNTWINCGKSGANVLTWQTSERGLPRAQAAGKAQAYVVGLMLNDANEGTDRYVALGTAEDIGTDAQTYYGGLSRIVESLAAISPQAKIFLCTCPKTTGLFPAYNQALCDVAAHYQGIHAVHCLDLLAYSDLYSAESLAADLKAGHYTAAGYEQFAEILYGVMSDYINAHVSQFQDATFIEYDAA